MIVVNLAGGFGNWMFQIAFSEYLKELIGKKVYISIGLKSPHAPTDLIDTVFNEWVNMIRNPDLTNVFEEINLQPYDWKSVVSQFEDLFVLGYFQNYTYITNNFLNKLSLPTDSLNRHLDIGNTVFLHIRGGDYVANPNHDIGLDNYYDLAIKEFPPDTKFSVFTNDISYTNSKQFLKNISYEIIQESEVDSMFLMSKCRAGICANSTFSWWGAFLNRNRKLILPSKWWNNPEFYSEGIYFPEATIVHV